MTFSLLPCRYATKVLSYKIYTGGKSGDVLRLVMEKPKYWECRAGQYSFILVPTISKYEWHPFTLTSAPAEPFCSMHIRAAGDWTKKLHQLVKDSGGSFEVKLDAPISTCSDLNTSFEVSILVGGGKIYMTGLQLYCFVSYFPVSVWGNQ